MCHESAYQNLRRRASKHSQTVRAIDRTTIAHFNDCRVEMTSLT